MEINILIMEQSNTTTQANFNTEKSQMAVISYITIIGLIIVILDNKDKKDPVVAFHIRQSAGLPSLGLVSFIVSLIPILGWIIWFVGMFVMLYLWVMGILNALKLVEKPVPFLGDKFDKWLEATF